ncbi:hypothetical protein Gotur_035583, partial [Gossypium turneri]
MILSIHKCITLQEFQKTHLVVNSNVADKGIFLHGPINS